MHVHNSIQLARCDKALEILTSREGARHFRDIRKYTVYERQGNSIRVEYLSFWGTTKMTLMPGKYHVVFKGTGPLGIEFGGSWSHVSDRIILEQTIHGIPDFGRSMVTKRITRALEDLKTYDSSL